MDREDYYDQLKELLEDSTPQTAMKEMGVDIDELIAACAQALPDEQLGPYFASGVMVGMYIQWKHSGEAQKERDKNIDELESQFKLPPADDPL